jgi:GT2 family glycosyltransferase
MKKSVFVVIPNYNGADQLAASIDSVLNQSYGDFDLIIVDNDSHDTSRQIIEKYTKQDPRVRAIFREKNYGFTGGVNPGLELAIKENATFAAPFNNDAIADKDWLKQLTLCLEHRPTYGIATCKLLHADGKTIDTTGDMYSVWGLPYPRGRDEPAGDQYDTQTDIFGASGGASIYRVAMLREIGLFDQDFFAYYEDIDISFRAQLAGWKVAYVPMSHVYHEQGATSSRMKRGFTTQQYMRNVPMVLIKDVPGKLLVYVAPRLLFAYSIFFVRAVVVHRTGWQAVKGFTQMIWLLPKKLVERRHIQKKSTVSEEYIWGIMLHDLPPNARRLRTVRAAWWHLTGRYRKEARRRL